MFSLNPAKMQSMMKKLGIKQEEIDAEKVIIQCKDKNIIIEEPSVVKINMQGQESWQITGSEREEPKESSEEDKKKQHEEDIKIIMEKTSCKREEAEKALEEEGDLAGAILKLSS